MSIKRFTADADTTITNAYLENLRTPATGSNMGLADSIEVFSIYAQVDATSVEMCRTLVNFPVADIAAAIAAGEVPDNTAGGNVSYILRIFNSPHPWTLPTNYSMVVHPVTTAWDEGHGLDMEEYKDDGASGVAPSNQFGGSGASWNVAANAVDWTTPGGDFDAGTAFTATFDEDGTEDVELDITSLVDDWLDGSVNNFGIVLKLLNDHEDGTDGRSYYTKKFFARGSEYFYRRPMIEARWDSTDAGDDRNNFYAESNLRAAVDNENLISIRNHVNGVLTNIPALAAPMDIKFYPTEEDAVALTNEIVVTSLAMDNAVAGVYAATVVLDTDLDNVQAVWQDQTPTVYLSESLNIKHRTADLTSEANPVYVTTIINLKQKYSTEEVPRLRIYTRLKDWSPTIYTVASKEIESEVVEAAYYEVIRVTDGLPVVEYGIGGTEHTKISYDSQGNYFDFDMELCEPGYMYRINLAYNVNGEIRYQPEALKFRVE